MNQINRNNTNSAREIKNIKFGQQVRARQRSNILAQARRQHERQMNEEIYYQQYDEIFMEELRQEQEEENLRRLYELEQEQFYEQMYAECAAYDAQMENGNSPHQHQSLQNAMDSQDPWQPE